VLARYLYETAIKTLEADAPMSAGVVVCLLHDAVETTAAAVAVHVDCEVKENIQFAHYWDIVPNGRKNPRKDPLPRSR
jgi:hypothetical protein